MNNLFVILFAILFNLFLIAETYHRLKRRDDTDFCNPTKPDKINVHIISHTHLDAGWVDTYDGYYHASVEKIMESVIEGLTEGNESRKFTFVEMTYFSRYYNSLKSNQKDVIKHLLSTGKLQFTSGGWVMNDEATPYYSMIIDQMSYGHRWINRTFGSKCLPTTGWQIDPFGHTREFASIVSQMGFNALFLGRIDYQDKEKRMSDKSMEFIWKTDQNLKQNNYLFTGITPAGYYPSEGVSVNGGYENNGRNLIKQVMKQIKGYRTNHIMETMGGDFNYVFGKYIFQNIDEMITHVNSIQEDIHLVYSTPDCYVKALYESDINWTDTKDDDFMPYADKYDDFWSGYFTSRPAFKYQMNYLHTILQISKQLIVKANIYSDAIHLIQPLEESFGICLHHDAISGTSKQFVSNDYIQMLSKGLASSEQLISIAYQKLLKTEEIPHFCHKLNVSECPFLEHFNGIPVEIAIYNPLIHRISHFIRLPLIDTNFQIEDSNGEVVESQIIPIPHFIQSLSERNSSAKYEIVFNPFLEPMSFTRYYLVNNLKSRDQSGKAQTPDSDQSGDDIMISNDKIKVFIDKETGLLKAIQKEGYYSRMTQNFGYYTRGQGKNSGAYAMHTNGPDPLLISSNATIFVNRGNIFEEVIQEFTPYLKQVIRIYKNCDSVEFEWTAGPLPNEKDFELISRYDTGFRSGQTFFTDSNGRQTVERIRDFRKTWKLETVEKVSSNYYPITSWIFIRDETSNLQLTVVPDRTQGGSSLKEGSIELMIHRRLHYDDGYGMEEKLDEPGVDGKGLVIRGRHYLFIDRIEKSMKIVKKFNKLLFWNPLPLFSTHSQNTNELIAKSSLNNISLTDRIDPSIHLLTLEELSPNQLFCRFENILEKWESKTESITFLLKDFFSGIDTTIEVISIIETSITGTESMSDMMNRKFKWKCNDCVNPTDSSNYRTNDYITLNNNQIKSFIINYQRSE